MDKAIAIANNDTVFISWTYDQRTPNCLGFAVYRADSGGTRTALFPNQPVSAQHAGELGPRHGCARSGSRAGDRSSVKRQMLTASSGAPGGGSKRIVPPR